MTYPYILFEQPTFTHEQRFDPFIYTDLLIQYAGEQQQPLIHVWTMRNEVILGMMDTRVHDLKRGVDVLHDYGYETVIRNSGGLAVVSDEGIVNISLILPQPDKKISINDAYELMKQLIETILAGYDVRIDAFEVTNSYCPGDYDLSINGKKFAGIAQRRIKNGVAVMIYLSVNGDQQRRGRMIRDFYQASLGGDFGKNGFPPVLPESMANLTELVDDQLTPQALIRKLQVTLPDMIAYEESHLAEFLNSSAFQTDYQKQLARMTTRNQLLTQLTGELI